MRIEPNLIKMHWETPVAIDKIIERRRPGIAIVFSRMSIVCQLSVNSLYFYVLVGCSRGMLNAIVELNWDLGIETDFTTMAPGGL